MAWYSNPTIIRNIYKNNNYVFIDESGDIKDLYNISNKLLKGENIDYRNANFVLTAIYARYKNLEYIYASLNELKKRHLNNLNCVIHSTEIFQSLGKKSGSGGFKLNLKTNINDFINDLNKTMISFKYRIVATAMNKVAYCNKYRNVNKSNSLSIILSIYKYEFIKIERMLRKFGDKACFVIEESSNPKLDAYILKLFVGMKKKKILINSTSLYFVKKSSVFYPCGLEVADYSSRAIYSYYRNYEFCHILKKVYDFGFYNENINFFDRKIETKGTNSILKLVKII